MGCKAESTQPYREGKAKRDRCGFTLIGLACREACLLGRRDALLAVLEVVQ